jgi:hypothetical protein
MAKSGRLSVVSGRRRVIAAVIAITALAAVAGCTTSSMTSVPKPPGTSHAAAAQVPVSPVTDVSAGCPGNSSEVEEVFAPPAYVYADWIGCGGIGFAASADDGLHFGRALRVPGSAGRSWDPALTVGPGGAVYVAFIRGHTSGETASGHPVVAVSADHGASFGAVHQVTPPHPGNWGDRDFIAAAPDGKLYLTWDYGPSDRIGVACAKGGSCYFTRGDMNTVIQVSADDGATWGPITPVEPGFPLGGGYGGQVIVAPGGHVDVLYWGHRVDPGTETVHPGYVYFTSSADGTHWPAGGGTRIGADAGLIALDTWWIDGDISADAAGNLYATWDTQTAHGDIGWLSWSADGGRTWSPAVRITPDATGAPHITESAGGAAGIAYVAWQTSAPAQGYATYLRPYSITRGWLGPATRVSAAYGARSVWPGDTFGIAVLPGGKLAMSWGSATGGSRESQIYAATITLPVS